MQSEDINEKCIFFENASYELDSTVGHARSL